MTKTNIFILFFAICYLLVSCNISKEQAPPPNIILIMADDLGYGDLGCYGAKLIETPNCDKLASEGMMFSDAHTPSAVCTPTRYSVLTGRYNWRSWLKNWVVSPDMPLLIDTARVTVQSMLQEKDYLTGCIGKWHLGWTDDLNPDWNSILKPGPLETGFDYFFGVPLSHNCPEEIQFYIENSKVVGLKEGESIYDSIVAKRIQRNLENTTIDMAAKAKKFIVENKEKPFFLYYPTTGVHWPVTPNNRFKGKSKAGIYGDFIVEFDWAVGDIMSTLDSLGIAENTLLVLTSDNGARHGEIQTVNGHAPNGKLKGDKCGIYEGGHRVPFIARWPGKIPLASTSAETICLTDFMATVAEIVVYPFLGNMAEDSYSILPVLSGKSYNKPIREATVHHSIAGQFAIRKGEWKLIDCIGDGYHPIDWPKTKESAKGKPVRDPQTGKFQPFEFYWTTAEKNSPNDPDGQLYNLDNDPMESQNLYNEKPEIVTELKALLAKYKHDGRSR